MSIDILYRKIVVELPNKKILSIIESWSNNTRDCNWKRSRSRDIQGYFSWTKEEVEKKVYNIVKPKFWEEINEHNYLKKSSQYRLSIRTPGNGTIQSFISYVSKPNTGYEIALKHIRINWKKINEIDFEKEKICYIKWLDEVLRENKIKKSRENNNKATIVKKNNFCILYTNREWVSFFISKMTRYWVKGYSTKMGAKTFETESNAKRYIKKLEDKMSSCTFELQKY